MLAIKQQRRLHRLEAIRGFAAACVVLDHSRVLDGTAIAFLGHLGQEAVVLFFILSGFVIHYSTFGIVGADQDLSRSPPWRTYLLHRFRRIYPLMVFSLLAAYAGASIAAHHWLVIDWNKLGGNLMLLQDNGALKRGVWFDTFCNNTALWSLSYEWWLYMLFFPLFVSLWAWPRAQKYIVAGLSAMGFLSYQLHPNPFSLILGYFFIWWTGVELSREYGQSQHITWQAQAPTVMLLGLLSLLWSAPLARGIYQHLPLRLGTEPVLQFRHFAAATLFTMAGIFWHRWKWRGFNVLFRPFALIAPISYSLYILHVPVFQIAHASLPGLPWVLRVIIVLCGLAPVCYVLEVRLQRRINRWFDRFNASPYLPSLSLALGAGQSGGILADQGR